MYSKIFFLAMACIAMVPIADSTLVATPCANPCSNSNAITTAITVTLNDCLVAIYATGVIIISIVWLTVLIQTILTILTTTYLTACLTAILAGVAVSVIAGLLLLILQCIVQLILIIISWLNGVISSVVCKAKILDWYNNCILKLGNYKATSVQVTVLVATCINVCQQAKQTCDNSII